MIRKGQIQSVGKGDILDQIRFVEPVFGLVVQGIRIEGELCPFSCLSAEVSSGLVQVVWLVYALNAVELQGETPCIKLQLKD